MTLWLLAGLLAPVLITTAIGLARPSALVLPGWLGAGLQTLAAMRAAIVRVLGRTGAFGVLTLSGAAATIVVLWPLGALAVRVTDPVDMPLYAWLSDGFLGADSSWTRLNETVTRIGDIPWESVAVALAGGGLVAIGWRARRWVPAFVLLTTLALEWFMQRTLASVIDRGYPPFGNGTYPSGGSARVIAIYGMIVFLAVFTWPTIGPRSRVALWSMVGILAVVEGYSRLYLLKHWPTDVPAGWLFGVLLLAVMVVSTPALGGPASTEPPDAGGDPSYVDQ